MASILGRTAFRATRVLRESGVNAGQRSAQRTDQTAGGQAIKKGARRDPELLVLAAIMTGVGALAGFYFSSSPTSANSEAAVAKVVGSEPWNAPGGSGAQYQYHPGGDKGQKRDAPSPLNVTIIPNVNLPKELHDMFNKYGKDDSEI